MDSAMVHSRILIVEDDRGIAALIKRGLRSLDLYIDAVYSGQEAIGYCRNHPWKDLLLLLDYQLGDMTAQDLILSLREGGIDPSFIVITGQGGEKIAVEMMKLGAYDYFMKSSASFDLLPTVIQKYLKEIEIQKALEVANKAIDASTSGIVVAACENEHYPILYHNLAFETISGFHSLPGSDFQDWLCQHQSSNQSATDSLLEGLGKKQDSQAVIRIRMDDDSFRWQQILVSFVSDKKFPATHVIGIVTDITSQIETELQKQKLLNQIENDHRQLLQSQIAAEIAHEIGTSLTLVSSGVQQMLAGRPRSHEELKLILRHVDRISHLIQDYSKSAFRKDISIQSNSIESIIDEAVELLAFHHVNTEAQFYKDIEPDLPLVPVDRCKIIQVLFNLLNNAIDANPANGQIRIRASSIFRKISESNTRQQFVTVSVEDQGQGISPDKLHKIFEPFFSSKSTDKSRGLGLSICKSIIRAHRGWIEVQSTPNQGTCMTLYLPTEGIPTGQSIQEIPAASLITVKPSESTLNRKDRSHG